jgi:hypothetical protein
MDHSPRLHHRNPKPRSTQLLPIRVNRNGRKRGRFPTELELLRVAFDAHPFDRDGGIGRRGWSSRVECDGGR